MDRRGGEAEPPVRRNATRGALASLRCGATTEMPVTGVSMRGRSAFGPGAYVVRYAWWGPLVPAVRTNTVTYVDGLPSPALLPAQSV